MKINIISDSFLPPTCLADDCVCRILLLSRYRALSFPSLYSLVVSNGEEALPVGAEGYPSDYAVMGEKRTLASLLRQVPYFYLSVESSAQQSG